MGKNTHFQSFPVIQEVNKTLAFVLHFMITLLDKGHRVWLDIKNKQKGCTQGNQRSQTETGRNYCPAL
jgi:hypothetical protein